MGEVDEAKKRYHRRNYVRSAFAVIEGMCFLMKDYAIRFDRQMIERTDSVPVFTEQEIDEMLEKTGYLPFERNVKISFQRYERLKNYGYKIDFRTADWEQILRGAKLRGRLMHPKSRTDIQISYEELDAVHNGLQWFLEQLSKAIDSHTDCIKQTGYL